jgi:uridine phosphorylase
MKHKDIEESIVKPTPILGFKQKTVLCFPYDPPTLPILKHLRSISKKEKNFPSGRLFILDKEKALLYGVLGAPALCLCLETLIASGVRKILFLGFSGSLNPDLPLQTAVSVSKAYSQEGTSRHYFPKRRIFRPSPQLKSSVEDILDALGKTYRTGTTVSTDAPYRETHRWLSEQQSRRIDCVDMEVSAVFSLAEYHGVRAAAVLLVSDILASGKWKKAFALAGLRKKTKDYFIPFFKKKINLNASP